MNSEHHGLSAWGRVKIILADRILLSYSTESGDEKVPNFQVLLKHFIMKIYTVMSTEQNANIMNNWAPG